ncbi:conserved hypothetical protein [Prosthecochloris aestuarii DSM 271]|uniref:START domain-containing protein n=1 Tax=Prosthecochloris aestuarii (strain DSM 271 / SK 413) TaxID=290512 RepID=B4S7L4_PROA2|nr:START domain-containing protein [Prosthecochloris aestuarii]ACF46051.1 conserved hypothetical protein [Prosthecochloris aestuarii DSM 271]
MAVDNFHEDNWEFRVEHKNIRVYSAKLEQSDILGFKGVTTLSSSLKKLISLFHDIDGYTRWVHQLSSINLLEKGDNLEYVLHQVVKAPWPLQPRDMIIRTGLDEAGEGGIAVTMSSKPDFIPENPRYARVRETYGKWVFEPLDDEKVRITFDMHVNPGRDIPSPVANTAMFEVPFYSLQNLRKLVLDPSYNPPYPSEVDAFISISEQ